jgi:hypothetical protein
MERRKTVERERQQEYADEPRDRSVKETDRDEFYEAVPLVERRYYREEPVWENEDDRAGLSGLAILGLVVAAIIVLALLLGGLGALRGVGDTTTTPTTLPTTNQGEGTPTGQ